MNLANKMLKSWTTKDNAWWVEFVQSRIVKRSFEKHGIRYSKPELWMKDVVLELRKLCLPSTWGADGNILHSTLISLIFTLWTCRVMRAKGYDTKRNLKHRKDYVLGLVDYQHRLLDCMADESKDHVYFPKQDWECPFPKKQLKRKDKNVLTK